MTLKTQVPESITSWMLSGFSINSNNGLGILKAPFILSTFKPFFVDINLPTFAKMGEIVEVKITIHNYLDKTARVEVDIDDTGNDFEFTYDGRQLNDFGSFDEDYEQRNINQNIVQVLGNGIRTTSFKIKPTKTGNIRIKVS
jgi:CD109 antigen